MSSPPEPAARFPGTRVPSYAFREKPDCRDALAGLESVLADSARQFGAFAADAWILDDGEPKRLAQFGRTAELPDGPPHDAILHARLAVHTTPLTDGLFLVDFPIVDAAGAAGIVRFVCGEARPIGAHLGARCEATALLMGCLVERHRRGDLERRRRSDLERLRESHKLELLGSLARGVAHDFNNVLTALLGHVQLIADAEPTATGIREHCQQASAAVAVGAQLAQQLVGFARARQTTPAPLDCNDVIRRIDRLLSTMLRGRQLELHLGEQLGLVRADPAGIAQTVLNLVLNARDAMPDGGRVLVETRCVTIDAGDMIRLRVQDEGIGMPPEVRQRMFEPLFTTKPEGEGSGLGLTIVARFVEDARGRIDVQSEVGRGTTVDVYLPRILAVGPP
ncbi:MAG: hypothetical protein IPM29_21300 [Planctomycetes bacterium]|nr:hypothetical protein [Planctomycetota bacterium]